MTRMHNPPHPGLLLLDILPALNLSVTEAAQQLGIGQETLSSFIHGRADLTPELALRLEAWLGVNQGGDALVWMGMQAAYDLWHAELQFKVTPMHVQSVPSDRGSAPMSTDGNELIKKPYATRWRSK